jgi:polyhydroxybutyrate depolymerase
VSSEAHRRKIDDVGFIAALLDSLTVSQSIDPRRVFSTGISNGGIFSNYLASRLSARIAAIAPVAGLMPDVLSTAFAPTDPVSVFELQGTKDPLVPFEGGGVARGNRGYVLGALESARKWAEHDGSSRAPTTGTLPDTDPRDGCRVSWQRWSGGRANSEVLLYTLEGGGHTWPGGRAVLPKAIIGNTCRDINATTAIWEFFAAHPKP